MKTAYPFQLQHIIGTTSTNNNLFTTNVFSSFFIIQSLFFIVIQNVTGDVAYAAGCVIVLYSFNEGRIINFFSRKKEERRITALCFSSCGKYLAAAEAGPNPLITIWEIETRTIFQTFRGHKDDVTSLAFSPSPVVERSSSRKKKKLRFRDPEFLVSASDSKTDAMIVWRFKQKTPLSVNRMPYKITSIAFSSDPHLFATAGQRHLKYWAIPQQPFTPSMAWDGSVDTDWNPLAGCVAILGSLRETTILGLAFTMDPVSGEELTAEEQAVQERRRLNQQSQGVPTCPFTSPTPTQDSAVYPELHPLYVITNF